MQFTLRQIELFVAVCDAGSISGAAQREHIAQSAVSTAIQNLEAVLGVSLFVRNHAIGVHPTPAGRELLGQARLLLATAQEIEAFGASRATGVTGNVPIGFLVTLAPILMAPIIRSFEAAFPGAHLVCREGDQEQLVAWLRTGEIGLAVSYDIAVPDDLRFSSITRVPPRVLIARDHPLAGAQSVIPVDLVDQPLVLLDLPGSSEYFLNLFTAEGLRPKIAYRSRNIDVVRSLVAQGLGYSIVNFHALGNFPESAGLASIPLFGCRHVLSLGTLTVAEQRLPAAITAARDHIADWLLRSGYSQDGKDSGDS
jgi:DNA-binding transcriptional LysR family regulator